MLFFGLRCSKRTVIRIARGAQKMRNRRSTVASICPRLDAFPLQNEIQLKLYEKLADEIEEAVRRGVFTPGEKIASVRQASQQHGVSIKTVLHAYAILESRGILETRPQSGYFVRAKPQAGAAHSQPTRVIATACC